MLKSLVNMITLRDYQIIISMPILIYYILYMVHFSGFLWL